jgi:hypothetical protein
MGEAKLQELPVVRRRDVQTLEGLVALDDVLKPYGLDRAQRKAMDPQDS